MFTNLRVRFPPGVEETGLVPETSLDLAGLCPAELLAVAVRVQQGATAVTLQARLGRVEGLVRRSAEH